MGEFPAEVVDLVGASFLCFVTGLFPLLFSMEGAVIEVTEVLMFKGMSLGQVMTLEEDEMSESLSGDEFELYDPWLDFELCRDLSLLSSLGVLRLFRTSEYW